MKIYSAIVALCVAQTAAFQAPTPNAFRATTHLNSEFGGSESFRDPSFSDASTSTMDRPAASMSAARNLEARLAALENGQQAGDSPGREMWERTTKVLVQGGSLKTWSFTSPSLERVQVAMKSDGRPLDADVELWHGPDNTPVKMRVYVEDGAMRQFSAFIETPRQGPNTIAIRNTANLEFPLAAAVAASGGVEPFAKVSELRTYETVQGGALRTYPFDPMVDSVQVLLKTDGRPLNARVELLQGPNNNKQVVEIYTEDGYERPFFAVIECPGSGNVVRVVNTATVEFPLTAWVEPYAIGSSDIGLEPVLGGDEEFRSGRY